MKNTNSTESGWRGSAEVWLDAAFESLLEGGIEAVRIQPMAEKLKLSRTSFYWFFKDREELLDALIERWRKKNTKNLTNQAKAYAETITEAIFNIFDCWIDSDLFDSKLEYAIRSWSLQSREVALNIHEADEIRLKALSEMFLRFDPDVLHADVRARTTYLTQIGYISMKYEESIATRMARIPTYVHIFTGKQPKQSELNRFFARHNFDPKQQKGKPLSRKKKKRG